MTSRDVSQRRLRDQLDVKIRWVLHESVADARPPLRVWGRIVERLNRQVGVRRATYWQGFGLACKGLALWLFDSAVDLPPEFAYCYSPRLSDIRDKDYLRLLIYQCDLPVLLVHAM